MHLAPSLHRKILSHRLRGFAEFEHSPSALRNACRTRIPYLEIDTRCSRDGAVFVYHDPQLGPEITMRGAIAEMDATSLARAHFRNGEALLSLADFLAIFAEQAQPETRLCIDIKDFGFEEAHLQAVRALGLEHRVVFVSWIPQTLVRLRELGATAPVMLSHINLTRFGFAGRLASTWLRGAMIRRSHFVLLGAEQHGHPLAARSHGFQHGYVCTQLPPALLGGLGAPRGICVHATLLSHSLAAYCRREKLELWVFSARDTAEFLRLAAHPGTDVVFSDNAPALLAAEEIRPAHT